MRLAHFFFGLMVFSLLPACEQSLEAQFNDDRKKYAHLIPTLPPPTAQLPVIGAPSDIGTESELLMVWRTQAFYWGYALESMGAELAAREGDIPLLVDLDAARIIWGPYRDSLIDEWCVISPLEDFNPEWSLGGSGQPFERSYGRLGANQLELLAEGELWLQLGTSGTETIRGLAFWDREEMLAQRVITPDDNAPLLFDSMIYVYTYEAVQERITKTWLGVVNATIPALGVSFPQLGALWGKVDATDRLVHYIVYAGVIDANGDGFAAEQAEIRIGYELVEGRIQAGRIEAFSATPDDTAIEGWAIIECLGAKGTVTESYRVPVQRGSGDADSALGAFSNQCEEGFRSGLSTLTIPELTDIPDEVLWLQSAAP